ncbi:MAG: hypothetical protein M1524_02920 [Patescibacteria group bacterium]|nr:hypothetical protein [Patescibacteria group bacterium]
MKKLLPRFLLTVLLFSILIQFSSPFLVKEASAQFQYPTGKLDVNVTASVGEFYLNLSGWISPFASVVLTTLDGVFIRSTVADAGGNFYISQVLIKKGFPGFCLIAIDYHGLGESTTCFNFPPAKGSITMKNIFLPPTLGLSKTEIAAYSTVIAFGYTMPFATVTLYLSNGQKLITTADANGYYEFKLEGLGPGLYKMYSKAFYNDKESLAPTKEIVLKALSLWEQFVAFLKMIGDKIVKFVTSLVIWPLLIAVPLIILIIILIFKLWPERFTSIYNNKVVIFLFRRGKKLHHSWWVGY